jgi:hypothetical protein
MLPAAEEQGWTFARSVSPSPPKYQTGYYGESGESIATWLEYELIPQDITGRSTPSAAKSSPGTAS